MYVDPQKLKKFLVDADLIKEKDFDSALELSKSAKKEIGDVLVEKELIDRERLIKFQAYLSGIPFVNIGQEKIEAQVLNIIPEQIAKAHRVIAFRRKANTIEVAMVDPDDLITIEFLKKADPSLKILPRLTTPEGIKNALGQYQKTLDVEFGNIMGPEIKNISFNSSDLAKTNVQELKKVAQELPIIKVVDTLLKHSILQKASDVHIEPLEKEVVVRFRIDGILHDATVLPIEAATGIVARIKVLSNLKLDEHRLPQDGRFKIETEDYKFSVRVSILPVFNGEKIVMRLLSENTKAQDLESLGFTGEYLKLMKGNLKKPIGMILITGPTGSGKTTTLYAMMEILNTPKVNISTIEDPIEYRMPRINQTQVNSQIGLTFASGLRALVRQDPNVIMVGEIRDTETAGLAVNAALTGHLVLSTLHTTTAAGAIPRLIDMQIEPFLISSTINVIIAQRLVRKFHHDKDKYRLKDDQIRDIEKYCDLQKILDILRKEKIIKAKETLKDVDFYRPKPSKESASGYMGRIGIFEILPVTESIKELVIKKASTHDILLQAQKEGMRTMTEDGFVKAAQGITSIEEVMRVIIN